MNKFFLWALLIFSTSIALGQSQYKYLTPNYWNYQHTWSPDGKQIAYASSKVNHPTLNLFVMNVDGTNNRQLTFETEGYGSSSPKFLKDGRQLVFLSDRGGQRDIHIINLDGSNRTKLSDDSIEEGSYLAVSPEKPIIYFDKPDSTGNRDIYSLNLENKDIDRITYHPWTDRSPTISPDGKYMAFETQRFSGNSDIVRMNLWTREIEQLTRSWADDGGCSYSNDGKFVYFYTNRSDPKYDVYQVDVESKEIIPVANGYNWQLDAEESPDGNYLCYNTSLNGRWASPIHNLNTNKISFLNDFERTPFLEMVKQKNLKYALKKYPKSIIDSLATKYYFQEELISLAFELIEMDRTTEALSVMNYAESIFDESIEISYYKGLIYRMSGKKAPVGFHDIYDMLESNDVSVVKTKLVELHKAYPGWLLFEERQLNLLGFKFHMEENYDKAIATFKLCLDYFSHSAMAHHDMANSYREKGNIKEAIRLHKQTVQLDPDGWYGMDSKKILKVLLEKTN